MKKNKKIIIPIIILVLVVGIILAGFYIHDYNKRSLHIANPSATYCGTLGYQYEMGKGEDGASVCIFLDGSQCTAWNFYEGKCGQNWSYCVQNGYDIETRDEGEDPYSPIYSVCIDKNTKQEVGVTSQLMKLEENLPSTIINNPIE